MAQGGPEAMDQNFAMETFDLNDTNKAIALLEENAFLMSNLMNPGLLVMRENPHLFSTPSSGDREFLGMSHYAVFPWESEVAEPIRTRMNLPEVQWFIALDFLLRYEEDRLKKKNNEEDLERYYLAPDPEHNSYYEIPVKGVVVVRVCILSDGTFRIETYDGKKCCKRFEKNEYHKLLMRLASILSRYGSSGWLDETDVAPRIRENEWWELVKHRAWKELWKKLYDFYIHPEKK